MGSFSLSTSHSFCFITSILIGVTVGFVEGGQAGNVIPETVKFGGTFRSFSSEGLSYLQQRIKEVYMDLIKGCFKNNSKWLHI